MKTNLSLQTTKSLLGLSEGLLVQSPSQEHFCFGYSNTPVVWHRNISYGISANESLELWPKLQFFLFQINIEFSHARRIIHPNMKFKWKRSFAQHVRFHQYFYVTCWIFYGAQMKTGTTLKTSISWLIDSVPCLSSFKLQRWTPGDCWQLIRWNWISVGWTCFKKVCEMGRQWRVFTFVAESAKNSQTNSEILLTSSGSNSFPNCSQTSGRGRRSILG